MKVNEHTDNSRNKIFRHRIMIAMILFSILLGVVIILDFYLSNHSLTSTEYIVTTSKVDEGIRIVHLTDLHNQKFGEGNSRLISKVKEQEPDLVCITGDMVNMEEDNTDIAINLISKLSSDFPVYVSMGNHEMQYRFADTDTLEDLFHAAGAKVLQFEYQDTTVKGVNIRIGGFYGYGLPEESEASRDDETAFLKRFQATDDYKLLLTHMPLGWYHSGSLDSWDVDLVLSGHTHGGQVRIPFAGGLYAPDLGWLPGRECGLYYSEDGKRVMALSRGLGNTEWIPRFHNIPEVVTIEIKPEQMQDY